MRRRGWRVAVRGSLVRLQRVVFVGVVLVLGERVFAWVLLLLLAVLLVVQEVIFELINFNGGGGRTE